MRRFRLIETNGAQVLYRYTKFGTIILRDEIRTSEWLSPGVFATVLTGTTIEVPTPQWIRRAAVKAWIHRPKTHPTQEHAHE